MIWIERGDHDLADITGGNGVAGAGTYDLHNQVLVDNHTLVRRSLEDDHAEVGGAERVVGIDPRDLTSSPIVQLLRPTQSMQTDFGRAVHTDRHQACAGDCPGFC